MRYADLKAALCCIGGPHAGGPAVPALFVDTLEINGVPMVMPWCGQCHSTRHQAYISAVTGPFRVVLIECRPLAAGDGAEGTTARDASKGAMGDVGTVPLAREGEGTAPASEAPAQGASHASSPASSGLSGLNAFTLGMNASAAIFHAFGVFTLRAAATRRQLESLRQKLHSTVDLHADKKLQQLGLGTAPVPPAKPVKES